MARSPASRAPCSTPEREARGTLLPTPAFPASSYQIGNPTDLDLCDDVYILPHADPDDWPLSGSRRCTTSWSPAAACGPDVTPSAPESLTSFTVGGHAV